MEGAKIKYHCPCSALYRIMKNVLVLMTVFGAVLIMIAFVDSFVIKIFSNETFKSIVILAGVILNGVSGYFMLKNIKEYKIK